MTVACVSLTGRCSLKILVPRAVVVLATAGAGAIGFAVGVGKRTNIGDTDGVENTVSSHYQLINKTFDVKISSHIYLSVICVTCIEWNTEAYKRHNMR